MVRIIRRVTWTDSRGSKVGSRDRGNVIIIFFSHFHGSLIRKVQVISIPPSARKLGATMSRYVKVPRKVGGLWEGAGGLRARISEY